MRLVLSKDQSAEREGTSKVNGTRAARRVKVTGDGKGMASHAGSLLLAELADRVGLTAELSTAMAHTRRRRSAHDPGVVLAQLAVMLADGGDCLADIAVLRQQPELFGRVGVFGAGQLQLLYQQPETIPRKLDEDHLLTLEMVVNHWRTVFNSVCYFTNRERLPSFFFYDLPGCGQYAAAHLLLLS